MFDIKAIRVMQDKYSVLLTGIKLSTRYVLSVPVQGDWLELLSDVQKINPGFCYDKSYKQGHRFTLTCNDIENAA